MAELAAAKRNLDRALREFRAMALIGCNMTPKLRERLDQEIASIPDLKAGALKELAEKTDAVTQQLRAGLGALQPMAFYLDLVHDMEQHPDLMLWLQKHDIDTQMFSKLADVKNDWKDFAPHVRFGIDNPGHIPASLEWRLLEATLFESAALLWNDMMDAGEAIKRDDRKIADKRYRELKRSTIRALFALFEGYLNGIAYDVILTTDITTLSKGSQEMLTERTDDGRARFKTTKEKIFGYPKIALGLVHSSVDEHNEHVEYILEHEKELRDAFVHPTPREESGQPVRREQTYYDFEFDAVQNLLTHTIGIIRYIDGLLNGRFGTVAKWLTDPAADRKFPEKTFD